MKIEINKNIVCEINQTILFGLFVSYIRYERDNELMKFRWDKKYLYWGITAFCVIAAGICFYYLLFHGSSLFQSLRKIYMIVMPIVYGLILAYFMTPILNGIENRILYPVCTKLKVKQTVKSKKLIRTFSIILTILIVFTVLYTFFSIVIPEIVYSIQSIIEQFPTYVTTITTWLGKILENNPEMESTVTDLFNTYSTKIGEWLNTSLMPELNALLKTLSLSVISFLTSLWNLLIGFIISIYVMASKELFAGQTKKVIYALFDVKLANSIIKNLRFTHHTFGGFISGKLLDSLIIGCICFMVMSIMNMPYTILISLIIGVTNIIPFFGPYLGAIPSAFLVLLIDPKQCLYFIIFIFLLQQFDGNFLGPKILGDSTGLSSFWVIFAITFFGGILGVLGMFIGVPLFAIIYAAIKSLVERNLIRKNLSINTEDYLNVGYIEDEAYVDYVKLSKKERKQAEATERALKKSQSPVIKRKSNQNHPETTNTQNTDKSEDKK